MKKTTSVLHKMAHDNALNRSKKKGYERSVFWGHIHLNLNCHSHWCIGQVILWEQYLY